MYSGFKPEAQYAIENPIKSKPCVVSVLLSPSLLFIFIFIFVFFTMSSLTFTAEVASSFFGLAYRNPKPFTLSLQTTLLPLLRRTTTRSQFLTHSLSAPFPLRPARRFTVAATTVAPPQSEDSDVSTVIPPDNRIPATIITGFLGSGKVSILFPSLYYSEKNYSWV